MSGIWIDPVIKHLKRTPAEAMLLARICYRAGIAKDGLCRDSNTELSVEVGIHSQSVSDLVKKLERDGILKTHVSKEKANARTIAPIRKILIPYKETADRYKEIADGQDINYKEIPYSTPSDYKENTDSKPDYKEITDSNSSDYKEFTDSNDKPTQGLSVISLDTISDLPIAYKEITDSYNKDRKPLENSKENPIPKKARVFVVADAPTFYWSVLQISFLDYQAWLIEWLRLCSIQPKKKKPPQVAPAPPSIVTLIKRIVEQRVKGYAWDSRNGKAAKEIADKLRLGIVAKKQEADPTVTDATEEEILNAFQVLIDRTAELKDFYQFTDLPRLNSQYNEIVTQLRNNARNHRNGHSANSRTVAPAHRPTEERVSEINTMFREFDSYFGGK